MPEQENQELTLSKEWPKTVDPASLYYEDGTVNIDAVADYIHSLKDDATIDTEQEPTELEQTTFSEWAFDIDVPTDDEVARAAIDSDVLIQTDPIDYAITAYIRHMIIQGLRQPLLGVSENLYNNPLVDLDFIEESTRFINVMRDDSSGAFEFIEKAQAALGEPVNDVNELKTIVAIPVAGHQEHANIYHSLEQFAKQTLDKDKFEVFLYLNMPGRDGDKDESLMDSLRLTMAELERFRADYPDVQVRDFATTYRGDPPTIGIIRSDLWATIAYDLQQRGRQDDIMVVSSDADIVSLNNNYLANFVDTFGNSDADVVAAELRWQPAPGLPYNSMTNRILRYQSFLDIVRDNHAPYYHTADANTGISMAAYMAVGGYNRQNALGEMNAVVNRIRYYRQSIEQREQEGYERSERTMDAKAKGAVLRTNSRRLIKAMALGASPYEAWDQKLIAFGSDDSLRTEEMQVAAAERSSNVHAKEWIASMTGPYVDGLDPVKKQRMLKAAHKLLGFDELYARKK